MPTNRRTLWLCVLTAAFVSAPGVLSFSRAVRAADEKKAAGDDKVKKSELNDKMEEMDEAMKRLRRTLRDAKQNEESLAQIKKFIESAKATSKMTPAEAAKQPEADRAKFVEEYHKRMEEVISDMTDMEKAVKDGKLDKAIEIHAKLKKMEEEGHKKFAPDEGDEKK